MPFSLNMPFCEIADDKLFGCHGNMNLDNSIVNLIFVLIIRCWLHNTWLNNQFYPLFMEILCFEYALFCKITNYLIVWLPW